MTHNTWQSIETLPTSGRCYWVRPSKDPRGYEMVYFNGSEWLDHFGQDIKPSEWQQPELREPYES